MQWKIRDTFNVTCHPDLVSAATPPLVCNFKLRNISRKYNKTTKGFVNPAGLTNV